MKTLILFLALSPLLCCAQLSSEQTAFPSGLFGDPLWFSRFNPACLPLCAPSLLSQGSNQFGLKELNRFGVAANLPLKRAFVSFRMDQFGFRLYNERSYSCALALRLNERFTAGAELNNTRISISESPGYNFMVGSAGVYYSFGKITGGVMTRFAQKKLRQTLRFAALIGSNASFVAEISNDSTAATLKTGINWQCHKRIRICYAVSFLPFSNSFGIALTMDHWLMSIGSEWHPTLGNSNKIALIYYLKRL